MMLSSHDHTGCLAVHIINHMVRGETAGSNKIKRRRDSEQMEKQAKKRPEVDLKRVIGVKGKGTHC